MIQRTESGGGVRVEVEKRGYEEEQLLPEQLASEADLARSGGNFVIERILFARDWQSDDLLEQTRSSEVLNDVKI